jgi:serralysin
MSANAQAREYYVSPTGNNSSSGLSLSEAFASIDHAADMANPGDIIRVADGSYDEEVSINRSGTADHWITFKAINKHGAKVYNNHSNTFTVRGNYIVIDGFELVASSTYGSGIAPMEGHHHISAINNYGHDCGEAGFGSNDSDYLVVENNIFARNGWRMPHCGSGISLYGGFRFDSKPGFHNIVRNNICYGNDNGTQTAQTDGNGIIIDDFQATQSYHNFSFVKLNAYNGINTLVEGNLCYNNGGAGIQIFRSNNVTVRNNTCYNNNTRNDTRTWRGEISISNASDTKVENNIAVCNTGMGFVNSSYNTGLFIGQFDGYVCKNIIWANNQTYNLADPNSNAYVVHDGAEVASFIGNLLGCDPLFVNPSLDPAAADFRLQPASSAINSGLGGQSMETMDLGGKNRVVCVIDRGAYESVSTADPVPCGGKANWAIISSQPETIPSSGPLGISIDYTTDGAGRLLVTLYDADWTSINTRVSNVSTGSGSEVINLPIASNLDEGIHHILVSLCDLNDNEKASTATTVMVVKGSDVGDRPESPQNLRILFSQM